MGFECAARCPPATFGPRSNLVQEVYYEGEPFQGKPTRIFAHCARPTAEVVGRRCQENILVHLDKEGHTLCGHEHCPLHRSIVTGQPSAEPLLVFAQHRSGARVPVEVTASPVRNHAGQVIGGIEVFRDLTATVQDQLRAKAIQELAIKCELPQDQRVSFEMRYQPRDIVGGGFFQVERVSDDCYAILVADAKGHGVAAALYMMLLRSLCQEYRPDLVSPARSWAC